MIKLDWSRLLGFDQADSPPDAEHAAASARPRRAQLGTKLGVKIGNKPDLRDVRLGGKIGTKANEILADPYAR